MIFPCPTPNKEVLYRKQLAELDITYSKIFSLYLKRRKVPHVLMKI